MAKKSRATYIPNKNIQSLNVKNGKRVTEIKNKDILDGAYVRKGVKCAKGGTLEVKDGEDVWYLTYIDPTHFYLSNTRDFKGSAYHVGQFRDRPFYNEVNEWLKSHKDKYEDGGSTGKTIKSYSNVRIGDMAYENPAAGGEWNNSIGKVLWKGTYEELLSSKYKGIATDWDTIEELREFDNDLIVVDIEDEDSFVSGATLMNYNNDPSGCVVFEESGSRRYAKGGGVGSKQDKANKKLEKHIEYEFVNTDMGSGWAFSLDGFDLEMTYLDVFDADGIDDYDSLSKEDKKYYYEDWKDSLFESSYERFKELAFKKYGNYYMENGGNMNDDKSYICTYEIGGL
jgi:hypothetical protein